MRGMDSGAGLPAISGKALLLLAIRRGLWACHPLQAPKSPCAYKRIGARKMLDIYYVFG